MNSMQINTAQALNIQDICRWEIIVFSQGHKKTFPIEYVQMILTQCSLSLLANWLKCPEYELLWFSPMIRNIMFLVEETLN